MNDTALKDERKMAFTDAHQRRKQQAAKWFAPARFGLFYHWGLYTGGACADWAPLAYPDVDSFERAAPDPNAVAKNMVDAAVCCGARYITLTALHTSGAYCVLYPTQQPGFVLRTRLDYIGAFIREAARRSIKPILYVPPDVNHWNKMGGVWLEEGYRDEASFAKLIFGIVEELAGQHGNALGGFWIDGMTGSLASLPARIHQLLPDSIVINNNNTFLYTADVDYGCTEFVGPHVPDPAYCRPVALRKVNDWNVAIPGSDFNEDIPTCNHWWHRDIPGPNAEPYLADPNFLTRQMLSSLGQRGQWNFALGIGPMIDGRMPPVFEPSLNRLSEFMSWGGEAVYNTTGGEHGFIPPGWFNAPWSPGGFCSVTISLADPSVHYVIVTTAPPVPAAGFHTGGRVPSRITDLRTGQKLSFDMHAGFILKEVDWSDVNRYGAKVLKVAF
jgi:hypothetical protein